LFCSNRGTLEKRATGIYNTSMLTVTAASQRDAECIARELSAFAAEVEEASGHWLVNVAADFEVVPILNALENCLGANRIDSVNVSYRGRNYVMETARPPTRL
jgi:hypothetical protein